MLVFVQDPYRQPAPHIMSSRRRVEKRIERTTSANASLKVSFIFEATLSPTGANAVSSSLSQAW